MNYTIRPTTEAEAPQIVSLMNAQQLEPLTVDEFLRFSRLRPAGSPHLRVVAVTPDDRVLGTGFSGHDPAHHPPGVFAMGVRVAAEVQRQGIGQALYERLNTFALQSGAERIKGEVRESYPGALAWARRRGFEIESHVYDSVLDLTSWDPTPWTEPIALAEATGIRFTTLAAEESDDPNLRRCHALFTRLVPDIPGNEETPEFPYDLWHQHISQDQTWRPDQIFLAVDGETWMGLTQLQARSSGGLYTNFTGVTREYRGRGVALALKLVALRYARAAGYPYVRTHNHSTNAPMLAVNRRLGFVPEPGHFNLERKV